MQISSLVVNFYCGTYLTWQTTNAFYNKTEESKGQDNLLIRWIILYLVMNTEGIFSILFDWIPIIGLFTPLLPLAIKIWTVLPHSQAYLKIYALIDQIELDEHTGRLIGWVQKITKYFVLRRLQFIENWVDMVQSDDLDEVEEALQKINQKIISKRSRVEIFRSSIIRMKKHDEQIINDSEPAQPQQENTIIQKIDENNFVQVIGSLKFFQNLSNLAGVMVVKASYDKQAQFKDYNLKFNLSNCELTFIDILTDRIEYKNILSEINYKNKIQNSLELTYHNEEDQKYHQKFKVIKLKDLQDTTNWLTPVLKTLVEHTRMFVEED